MSEQYKITSEDEAAVRRAVLEQIALQIVFVGEGFGAPQVKVDPAPLENSPAAVDGSVTIEAKE